MKLYGENDGRVGLSLSYLARVKCAKGEFNDFPTCGGQFFFPFSSFFAVPGVT